MSFRLRHLWLDGSRKILEAQENAIGVDGEWGKICVKEGELSQYTK